MAITGQLATDNYGPLVGPYITIGRVTMIGKPFPRRPIKIEVSDTGCMLVISHKPNQDGYIRVMNDEGKREMYHRTVYRKTHGLEVIPEGYEIDHMCRVRNCCNPEHLQLLTGHKHTVKTNKERYADRKEAAYIYWVANKPTGTELAELFGVSFSSGCGWIREWNKQLIGNKTMSNYTEDFENASLEDVLRVVEELEDLYAELKAEGFMDDEEMQLEE